MNLVQICFKKLNKLVALTNFLAFFLFLFEQFSRAKALLETYVSEAV